ncbi:MAG: SUMF1/EgtB/PvdO family nonheme iron enzyme [Bacteroidetes bacterium]|nr:SUMF1/EgtB/PvdO family nonheme iron enzyme [Bacteroidota bacterium]
MKPLLTPLLFFALSLQAQFNIRKSPFNNFMAVRGDYLYMHATEISNAQYREFLQSLRKRGRIAEYHANLPDTTVWRGPEGYNEPFVEFYLKHPAYSDYPVVGITQKQALAFCRWMEQELMIYAGREKSRITGIRVRLPSRKEWMDAARGKNTLNTLYPWPGTEYRFTEGKKREIGKIRMNFSRNAESLQGFASNLNDAGFITTPVFSYWPNDFELYNMCGNVAEWIAETGCTKGGAWCQTAWQCRIDVPGATDGDTLPKNWIGFRPVLEIVSVKPEIQPLAALNAKLIDKEMAWADTGLYAGITEVSNQWYQTFLAASAQSRFAPADSLWLQKDPYLYHLHYSRCAAFVNHPVVNISREGAEAYCRWLTQTYLADPARKHKKVVFRLPTAGEWATAAHGNRTGSTYPWGGPYARNSRGCWLANHHPMPDAFVKPDTQSANFYRTILPHDSSRSRSADGAEFTCPVRSYFPNDFGLYCLSGNAAEMVQEPDITVGGSWDSETWLTEIPSLSSYTHPPRYHPTELFHKPSPTIGFRVFMEVLK